MNAPIFQTSSAPVVIDNGREITFQHASSSHERYWNAVTSRTIDESNCPKLVLFSFTELQTYLKAAAAEFDRLGIPEDARGIALLPVIHEDEQRFNILFTPCVKDANNDCHHQFDPTNSVDDDPLDWMLDGFNFGGIHP